MTPLWAIIIYNDITEGQSGEIAELNQCILNDIIPLIPISQKFHDQIMLNWLLFIINVDLNMTELLYLFSYKFLWYIKYLERILIYL